MRRAALSLSLAVSGLLAACATDHHASHAHHGPVVSESARHAAIAAADWDKAQKITIELRDYGFVPRDITLRRGQAYRLRIHNTGGNTHYFNAPEFFHTIAARKVEIPEQAEVKAEFFSQFEIARRGGQLEFEFVPLVPGRYRAHCHLEGHAERGVEGFLTVE